MHMMQRRRGVGDERARLELDDLIARRCFDDKLATLVAVRVGQKQRERNIRAHSVHQRIIDMTAVMRGLSSRWENCGELPQKRSAPPKGTGLT